MPAVTRRPAKHRRKTSSRVRSALAKARSSAGERPAPRLKRQTRAVNANLQRLRNRGLFTGRPRGVYSKFGLGRNKFREYAMRGEVPGIVKASW